MPPVSETRAVAAVAGDRHNPHMDIVAARPGLPAAAFTAIALLAAPAFAQSTSTSVHDVMAAEDARPRDARGLRPILDGLTAPDPAVRAAAVRALGRLERDELLPRILPALSDPDPTVRATGAMATEMAVRERGYTTAYDHLRERVAGESDPTVLGALAYSLGSLPYPSADVARPVARLLSEVADTTQPIEVVVGVARGFEALFRTEGRGATAVPEAVRALRAMARYRRDVHDDRAPMVRRLAVSALRSAGRAAPGDVREWLTDSDHQVRRLALGAVSSLASEHRLPVLERGMQDDDFSVRHASLQLLTATPATACEHVLPLDGNPHVRLLSIDVMADCEWATAILDSLAGALPSTGRWHDGAHALVSLAAQAPDRASDHLDAFVRHEVPFVRMYAARAATLLADTARLYELAADAHHNVREVSLRGLSRVVGHRADSVFIANLSAADYQLVMTAATVLEGTAQPGAGPALWSALARITEERRETSRDARLALLARAEEVAGVADSGLLRSYLTDFDAAIARYAGRVLEGWTGAQTQAAPRPLMPLPFPSTERIAQLRRSRVVLHMAGGGEIVIRLRPERAPTNSDRFARFAENRYLDGLTFHRVVPNFVIQGGSPGANEYAGDGPYTRDELTGDPHIRGTVGLSTRGHDTGDGQLFVNLVDNYRLDPNYTLFGEVESGMDIVDAILEGAVIVRAELRPSATR